MKILITGVAGFIGSNCAVYFQERGHTIIGVDNLSRPGVEENWKRLAFIPFIKLHKGDIFNKMFIDSIIKMYKPDAIIHLAGQTAVTTSMVDPEHDFDVNVIGTVNILESVRTSYEKYPKIIFASTNKVYGDNVEYQPVSVLTRVDHCHHSPYGASKLCADIYMQEYCHTYGIPVMVCRMSCIYGPHQFGVEDQGWVAHFVISAIMGKPITIYGDGEQRRDLLYIDDLCNLYHKYLVEYDHDFDWPYVCNVGGGEKNTMSLKELIAFLQAELKIQIDLKYDKVRPADQQIYISQILSLKHSRGLNWEPQFDPTTGIRRLISWVELNRELWM